MNRVKLAALAATSVAAGMMAASQAQAATYVWSTGTYAPGVTSPSPLLSPDVLSIQGSGNKSFLTNFTNTSGTVEWLDGSLFIGGGSIISNASLWTMAGDNTMTITSGGGTFVNEGLFRKDGGTGVTTINAPFVNNGGTIDAVTGMIRFSGSGQVFNTGTSFTGAGVNEIAGSAAFNGAIGSTNLDFNGGAYTGTDAVLSGTADFIAGTFAGDWTIASGAGLNITGVSNKNILNSFTNDGAVNWANATLFLGGGGTLTNNGTWLAAGDNVMTFTSGGGTFVNTGLLRKDGGTGVTTITAPFVNNGGTIDAATGTLRFNGGSQVFNTGTSFTGAGVNEIAAGAAFNGAIGSTNLDFNGGTYTGTDAVLSGTADFIAGTFANDWTIASGAALNITGSSNKSFLNSFINNGDVNWADATLFLGGGGTLANNGTMTVTGDNVMTITSGGGVLVNNGLIQKTAGTGTTNLVSSGLDNNGQIDVQSGTIALPTNFINDGTLSGTATYSVAGTLTNNGTIAPGAGGVGVGTLALTGNYVQGAAGTFSVGFGPGGTVDLFNISGTAALNGSLGLSCLGCSVNAGDLFTILDSVGDLSGVFANSTATGFDAGFLYSVVYDTVLDRVQIRVDNAGTPPNPGAVPEPATWAMMLLGFGAVGSVLRRRRPRGGLRLRVA